MRTGRDCSCGKSIVNTERDQCAKCEVNAAMNAVCARRNEEKPPVYVLCQIPERAFQKLMKLSVAADGAVLPPADVASEILERALCPAE